MKTLLFALTLLALVAAELFSTPVQVSPAAWESDTQLELAKRRRDGGDDESKEEDYRFTRRRIQLKSLSPEVSANHHLVASRDFHGDFAAGSGSFVPEGEGR